MNKLRVAHTRPIWLKQTETWLYNQVAHLDQSIEPHIVCEKFMNLDQFKVSNMHSRDYHPFLEKYYEKLLRRMNIRFYSKALLRTVDHIKPSILHSHFGPSAWFEITAAKKTNMKHIVTFYGGDVNRLPHTKPIWKERYKQLFRHIDLVLCEGSFMARSIVNLGCPESKVKVHHLGIPVHRIPFRPRMWQKGQPLRVLIAASFSEKKGIPYALEALGKTNGTSPLQITIIGDAGKNRKSKIEKKKILETITRYNLAKRTRMLGYQPYSVLLKEAYDHHVFMAPSVTASDADTEGGLPVSIIEMAASGMPVVSSNHCDIPELIHDRDTGLVAEERDVCGLIDRLKWLTDNSDKWVPLAKRARHHIEQEYNAKNQGLKLSELYREIVGLEKPRTSFLSSGISRKGLGRQPVQP